MCAALILGLTFSRAANLDSQSQANLQNVAADHQPATTQYSLNSRSHYIMNQKIYPAVRCGRALRFPRFTAASLLPDNFITAMIMQESSFRPKTILDPSDPNPPQGLMQVKPSTFDFMQTQYPSDLQGLTRSQLTDASVSIKVGTSYLRYLLTGQDAGNLPGAVKDYGTGYYSALQAGANYLDKAGNAATTFGLYDAISHAK